MASLVICATVFYLYSISLGHNFLFDEVNIILLNPLIHDVTHLPKLLSSGFFSKSAGTDAMWDDYYRPLTSLTFALNYWAWGANPLGYNLVNTFLHCLVCVLFFRVLWRIFGSDLVAFLGAFLYAVHPIHTEAVTYIASRGDLLGTVFLLGCLLLYDQRRMKLVFFMYVASLFSKESCLLIPAYLLLWDWAFVRGRWTESLRRIWPLILAGALYIVYRKFFCPIPLGPSVFNIQHAAMRVLSMGVPFLHYISALFYPAPFKFCEEVEFIKGFSDPQALFMILIMLSFFILWLLALKYRGAAFFGLSLFLVSLAPSFQIFMHLYPEWAEHYLYVPSLGLVILLSCLVQRLIQKRLKTALFFFFAVYAAFALFFSWRTVERNTFYTDTERYYEALSTSSSPYAYYGYTNLALIQVMNGSWSKAYVFLKTAWLINPKSECNNYNLGMYRFDRKDYEKALEYFEAAYKTENGMHEPMDRLRSGLCLVHLERYDEAIRFFEEVQKKAPESALIYKNFVRVYELSGKPDLALAWANKGLAIVDKKSLDHAALLMETVILAYLQGRDDMARAGLENILREHPGRHWYSDTAKFMKGEMAQADYEEMARASYKVSEKDVRYYLLVSHVLNRRLKELSEFLKNNREKIMSGSDDPFFTKMMLDRANKFAKNPG